jgi:hypothetical protein
MNCIRAPAPCLDIAHHTRGDGRRDVGGSDPLCFERLGLLAPEFVEQKLTRGNQFGQKRVARDGGGGGEGLVRWGMGKGGDKESEQRANREQTESREMR